MAINVYGATVSSKLKDINVFPYHISEQPNERQRINLLLLSEDAAENQTKYRYWVHLSCKPITKTGLAGGLVTDRSTIQLEGLVGGLYTGISTI